MNINALFNLSYGVYVVSSMDGERPTGCIANSLMQVTAIPSTVAVSINRDNFTNECITKTGKFAVSVLPIDTEQALIVRFGFRSGRSFDKFDQIPHEMVEGMPILSSACSYMVFRVIDKMETQTHTIFLGEMIEGDNLNDKEVMTYSYYHKVLKGKSPKSAPTALSYSGTEQTQKPAQEPDTKS